MAAHENLLPYLSGDSGKAFVKDLTQRVYLWAEKVPVEYYIYRIFTEVTIRKATGERTRLGLDKSKHFRFDAIFFVQPGNRALNQKQCYTVGVELKNSKSDLMNDKKMENYLGYTDFFFIGVPSDLGKDALQRSGENPYIGVFDLENGLILKLPKRNSIEMSHQIEIYEQILYNTLFNELKSVVFEVSEVDVVQPHFTEEKPVEGLKEAEKASSGPDGDKTELEEKAKEQKQKHREELKAKKEALAADMKEQRNLLPNGIAATIEDLSLKEQQVYCMIHDNENGIQVKDLAENLSNRTSEASIKRHIAVLKDMGLIERQGNKRDGAYVAVKDYQCKLDCMACAKSAQCKEFQKVQPKGGKD